MQEDEEFRQLYCRHIELVYRICLLYLKNTADAEDAVQSVFLKVWEKSVCFRDENHEKAWLITASRNYCRDVMKSSWKRKRAAWEEIEDMEAPETASKRNEVFTAVMELPAKYREVLYLYYYEGYSVKEMAAVLHRKESTLQTRLATARKRLKSLLEKEG